ncbi:MAG: hypothetical protein H6735_23340 [Alphaproteobacteria bacterium]|nr:hypothetical protein [Alphaproteobacteria bacterium]
MPVQRLQLCIAVPVPVGHRVRITWYREEGTGFFGKGTREDDTRPRVEDLDSGVVYEPYWLVDDSGGAVRLSEWMRIGGGPALTLDRTLEGKVRACRVITYAGSEGQVVQTLLDVE